MRFEPIFRTPTAWSVVARRFGVHLFEGKVTVADMERMERLGADWYSTHPGRLVELVVVFPSDTRMSTDERHRMARLIKRWEKDRDASATVILAEGMMGAVHRSVLTGLLLFAPPPHPAKVFGTVPAAVTWLAPYVHALCGTDATTEQLLAGVDALCSEFRARAP